MIKDYYGNDVVPCTKYWGCRLGSSPSTVCGECMRVGNPPEPVKVRVRRFPRVVLEELS